MGRRDPNPGRNCRAARLSRVAEPDVGLFISSAAALEINLDRRQRAGNDVRAGAVEAIFCILAIRDRVAPPTINLDNPSVETPIDLVPHKARQRDIDVALSNSFGFGGTNASLIFRRYNG